MKIVQNEKFLQTHLVEWEPLSHQKYQKHDGTRFQQEAFLKAGKNVETKHLSHR